jgi:hypothetical protein
MQRPTRLLLAGQIVSLLLYVQSFRLPALLFRQVASTGAVVRSLPTPVVKTGSQLLLASLAGPFLLNFAFFANPLLFVGWVWLWARRDRPALFCMAGAMLCALQTFQVRLFPYPEDEGGVMQSFLLHHWADGTAGLAPSPSG